MSCNRSHGKQRCLRIKGKRRGLLSLLRNVFVLNYSYARLSPESVQVKLSAFEIKVKFTILLENYGQDFRLIMNDLSNLFRAKESMARYY